MMNYLKLSELIGQEILELRFHYIPENGYGSQSFYSYIKLGNDIIIDIPHFCDDDNYLQLTDENLDYFKTMFDTGQAVRTNAKSFYVGQKITDFYFAYYNGEIDNDHSAFIKLSNGYYLTENNLGPVGLTNIDLVIFNEAEFAEEVKRLKSIEVEVRSFVNMK